jgi:hypothetical protein
MSARKMGDVLMPWGGLIGGTLGAGLTHQLGADATFQDCTVGSPLVVTVAMLLGLALIAGGAFASWRIYAADGETPARRTVALVSLMATALFALAVILPFLAALIIPRCWA